MSICDHILVLRNNAIRLPDCEAKMVMIDELDKFLSFCEKHESGDKAISDEFHKMCGECQKLYLDNQMLRLEIERIREEG